MNVLVIGGGGREHALCWKLAQSPELGQLFCAPGNPGISRVAACVPIDPADHEAIVAFCRREQIGLVVIGPEQPLVDGLADSLRAAKVPVFGPTAEAARLEGSKGFTKDLCRAQGIPTAAYQRFGKPGPARAYAATQKMPIVIKADGLAAGKGVVIAQTLREAEDAIEAMFTGRYGKAGAEVVIEEFLTGEEASFFALVDGPHVVPLASAQDHKRVGEGDTGPNTGGMGAYSPAPVMTAAMEERVIREIIRPTARAMDAAGVPFCGVLFAGLMITADGPKLIEYNARFGDPECEVLMMRLTSDLLPALHKTCHGKVREVDLEWSPQAALTVVMAAKGYPDAPRKGTVIKGLDAAEATGATVFHAGTARDGARLVASGGRVLAVTALGENVREAAGAAYAAIARIDWPGGFFRRDIGRRAIERERVA